MLTENVSRMLPGQGGCRYMCHYTHSLKGLGNGDVAVFSVGFNASVVKDLRRKGVLIAFESGESPVHMPHRSLTRYVRIFFILLFAVRRL